MDNTPDIDYEIKFLKTKKNQIHKKYKKKQKYDNIKKYDINKVNIKKNNYILNVSQREIVYPYFLHCCSKTADHFWKYIFEDLSYGKTPYGSYINKNFLCCNFKGKNFSYKLDFNKTYDKTFNDIYDLFVKKLGILSPTDKFNKRKKFDKQSDDMSISNVIIGLK